MSERLQAVFDGAEAAQDALHAMAGIEQALTRAVEDLLAGAENGEQVVQALIGSIGHYRVAAQHEVSGLQRCTFGGD